MRDELRALARLAAPLVGANLLQMAVYAVDVIFVARLGADRVRRLDARRVPVQPDPVGADRLHRRLRADHRRRTRRAQRMRCAQVRRSFRMAMWLGAIASAFFMIVLSQGERDPAARSARTRTSRARTGAFLDILLFVMLPNVWAGVMRTAAAALGRPGWALIVTVDGAGLRHPRQLAAGVRAWRLSRARARRIGDRQRRDRVRDDAGLCRDPAFDPQAAALSPVRAMVAARMAAHGRDRQARRADRADLHAGGRAVRRRGVPDGADRRGRGGGARHRAQHRGDRVPGAVRHRARRRRSASAWPMARATACGSAARAGRRS